MLQPDTLRILENFRLSAYRFVNVWPNGRGQDVQYKNVPIEHLEDAKRILNRRFNALWPYRIRYRGPRLSSLGDTRPASRRHQDCLKRFATRFTVYLP